MSKIWPLKKLQLEIVNICNYKCPLCDTLKDDWVPRVRLSLENAKVLIDKVYEDLEHVTLYGTRGEPLINKDLEKIVEYIRSRSSARVTLSTNASLLKKERIGSLLTSGIDKIIIAIDGLSQETYSKYRVGGKLDKVVDSVKLLCDCKRDMDIKCDIVLQFIPMSSNEHELSKLKDFAQSLGVDKLVVKLSSSVESSTVFKTKDLQLAPSKYSESREIDVCPFGLEKIYIDPNGYSYPCCYTEGNKDFLLGNMLTQDLAEIWDNPIIWNIRGHFAHQEGYTDTCKMCLSVNRKKKVLIE